MAKGSVRKKGKNGTTAFMFRTQAVTWYRKSVQEQKAKAKRKSC